ncbi:tolB protein [Acidisarcina polymorpha]|uniref:TolB protein n=1 Tax=Acidisarcina polymorpha TaxID=2211140 RepID=A0A2Z5GAQ2_9BACT|nr:tolB protein [Acidisarcina polymorpha]
MLEALERRKYAPGMLAPTSTKLKGFMYVFYNSARSLRSWIAVFGLLFSIFASAQTDPILRHMTNPSRSFGGSSVDQAVNRQLARMEDSAPTPTRVALSPDGALLAWSLTKATGTTLQVNEMSDPRHQVVVAPVSTAGVRCSSDVPIWSPDSATLAFMASCTSSAAFGGLAARPQQEIFLWDKETGTVRQLTHLTGGLSNLAWSSDGKSLLFLFIENATRDPGYGDPAKPLAGVIDEEGLEISRLYEADATTGRGDFLTPDTMHVYEFGLASNSREIVFLAAPPPGEASWPRAKLYAADKADDSTAVPTLRTRVLVEMQATSGPLHGMQMAIPRLSPDGKRVAFVCGLMSDPVAYGGDLCVANTQERANGIAAGDATVGLQGSVQYEQWLTNDKISLVENRNGHTLLVEWDLSKHQPSKNGTLDLGEVTVSGGGPKGPAGPAIADVSYAPAHEAMAFLMQGHSVAPEIYIVSKGALKQFTHLNDGLQPPTRTISVEWENEGFHVQGWLSFPVDYDPKKTYPLLVEAHGGPEWSIGSRWDGDAWRGISSLWPGLGYFLFLPNPRGSYGQGEAFTLANRRDLGYGDLRDVLKGVDTIEAKYPIDKSREGLLGWSYGGCMTMFGVTQTQRFHAAVAGAGIANYTSFYGETFFTTFTLSLFGGTPYDDPAIYSKLSATSFIKQAKTPTLVVVGERDQGSTPEQSLEFWRGLRTVGTPTQLMVYPGEGHNFNKKDSNDSLRRSAEWFAKFMPASQDSHEKVDSK